MWLSIIQICNCWNKKMCMLFFVIILYIYAYSKYFEIKSIADFTDFLTRSFSAAVQRCASHKWTFKGQKNWLFDQNKFTYVCNTILCIIVWMKSYSRFLLKLPSLVQKKMIPQKSFELKFELKIWLIDTKCIGVSTDIVLRLSYRR